MNYPKMNPCPACGNKIKRTIDSDGERQCNRFVCETCGLIWWTQNDDSKWYNASYDGGESLARGDRQKYTLSDIIEWNSIDQNPLAPCMICKNSVELKSDKDRHDKYFIECTTCGYIFHGKGYKKYSDIDWLKKTWNSHS